MRGDGRGLLESMARESIIKMGVFESKRCGGRHKRPRQSQERSGGVSCALEVLGAADQVVAQVPEEKLNRHLEKMAEEERVTEIRELRAVLPATELGGGFVPEEGRELLARHASFHARDPETILNCGSRYVHRTQTMVNGRVSLSSAYAGVRQSTRWKFLRETATLLV